MFHANLTFERLSIALIGLWLGSNNSVIDCKRDRCLLYCYVGSTAANFHFVHDYCLLKLWQSHYFKIQKRYLYSQSSVIAMTQFADVSRLNPRSHFNARHFASAVYAVIVCLSVRDRGTCETFKFCWILVSKWLSGSNCFFQYGYTWLGLYSMLEESASLK